MLIVDTESVKEQETADGLRATTGAFTPGPKHTWYRGNHYLP